MGIYATYIHTLMANNKGKLGDRPFDEKPARLVAETNEELAEKVRKKYLEDQQKLFAGLETIQFPIDLNQASGREAFQAVIDDFSVGRIVRDDLREAHANDVLILPPSAKTKEMQISEISRGYIFHMYTDSFERDARANKPNNRNLKMFLTDISHCYDQDNPQQKYEELIRFRVADHLANADYLNIYLNILGENKFKEVVGDVLRAGATDKIRDAIQGIALSRGSTIEANAKNEKDVCDVTENVLKEMYADPKLRLPVLQGIMQVETNLLHPNQMEEFSNLLFNLLNQERQPLHSNDPNLPLVNALEKHLPYIDDPQRMTSLHKQNYHNVTNEDERQQFIIGLLRAPEKVRNEILGRQMPLDINHLIVSLERDAPERKGVYDKFPSYGQLVEKVKEKQQLMDKHVEDIEKFANEQKKLGNKGGIKILGIKFGVKSSEKEAAARHFIDSYKRGRTQEFFSSLHNKENKQIKKALSHKDLRARVEEATGKSVKESLNESKPRMRR